MSLSIFDRGEGRFDLVYGDTEIGWVSDRAIGFNGFGDRAAARRGATVAYDALTRWLARQRRYEARPPNGNALRAQRDGGVDRLMVGEVSVGRLFSFGIETHSSSICRRALAPRSAPRRSCTMRSSAPAPLVPLVDR